MNDLIEPQWEKQPDEPQHWFERFNQYARPLGVDYTTKRAYSIYRIEMGRKGVVTVQSDDLYNVWLGAAAQWQWEVRAREWANEDRKTYELMWQIRRRELLENDWSSASNLRDFAGDVLKRMIIHEVVGEDEEGNKLIKVAVKPGELAVMMRAASDLQRLSVGEPTTLSGSAQASVSIYLPSNDKPADVAPETDKTVGGSNE